MEGIVDRIENDMVVLEINNEYQNLPKALFPKDIEEGDIVKKQGKNYIILEEKTKERRKYMEDLLDSFFD